MTAATLLAGFLVTGVAYAFWTASGTGTAVVGSASAVSIKVSSLAVPLADLYPGKTDALGFTLTNPNPYPVSLTGLTAVSVTSSDPTSCPLVDAVTSRPNVTVNSPYAPLPSGGYLLPSAITVPANNGTATGSLPAFLTMTTDAGNGCQGRTFTVTLTLTGMQG